MNLFPAEVLKDPIFQLAAVVFLAAAAIAAWMILSSAMSAKKPAPAHSRQSDETLKLSQDAKFQLLLENVIAINKRLDEMDARLKSGSPVASGGADIAQKLDAMYKILAALSAQTER